MTPPGAPALITISRHRWQALRPFAVLAGGAVVVGGLVAAVTGPLRLATGPWAAAYLVLVMGAAQLALAIGRVWLPAHLVASRARLRAELAAWNVGSLGVLAGTMVQSAPLVGLGSVALLAALVSFAEAARRAPEDRRRQAIGYLLLLAVLIVSVLVGTGLSVSRHT